MCRPIALCRWTGCGCMPARPAGVNEPTAEGVRGGEEILRIVGSLGPDDLCFVLISGGGSALLPAPAAGVSLADKLAVTRHLSAAGANIAELNAVRRHLSRIKGGGLARACHAGRLLALIISDVPGDPLDVIASGPTVDNPLDAGRGPGHLERFGGDGAVPAVASFLQGMKSRAEAASLPGDEPRDRQQRAGGRRGRNRGRAAGLFPRHDRGGRARGNRRRASVEHLAEMARAMLRGPGPNCLISGGEPVVKLVPADRRGKGGAISSWCWPRRGLTGREPARHGGFFCSPAAPMARMVRPTRRGLGSTARFLLARRPPASIRGRSWRGTTPIISSSRWGADQNRSDAHQCLRRAGGLGRAVRAGRLQLCAGRLPFATAAWQVTIAIALTIARALAWLGPVAD